MLQNTTFLFEITIFNILYLSTYMKCKIKYTFIYHGY